MVFKHVTWRSTISRTQLLNHHGSALIAVLLCIAITIIVVAGVATKLNIVNKNIAQSKRFSGTDSLVATLLPILTEQSVCMARLQLPRAFSAAAATTAISTNGTALPLSFSLSNPATPIIGSATPTYFSQFGLYVGQIYFSNAVSSPINNSERSPGALNGLTIYEGQVWATTYTNTSAGVGVPGLRLIANNFYVWTNGTNILSCGIIKTPEQFCRDDLGGSNYVAGAIQPCVNPQYPCPAQNYFLGYTSTGAAQCAPSPATCAAGQTIVSNGAGGTSCQSVP
jgi:hypothetical protein